MIEVKDLIFEYPTARALDRVNLKVEKGAIAALVGPNGAGKTTLLRCLAALDQPYSGSVQIDGLDTQGSPREIHERVGYLTDFFGLYDELTVQQCLFFAARSHGLRISASEDAVKRTADRVTLSDRITSKAGELSRGLRQRLAIGQAIVHEPRLLLLDEPASGLDPEARRSLSDLLLSLREIGMTQIVSSHILAELEDYSSHMIIMDKGKIVTSRTVSGDAAPKSVVRIELATPDARLKEFLSGQAGVTVARADDRSADVLVDGDAQARAILLKVLIEAGFAVSGMTEQRQRLEDAYFEEIEATRSGGAAGGE
jgi:ABC-2 type transport system ATP-binding protein